MRHRPKALADKNRDFGRSDRNAHVDDQWYRSDSRQQPGQDHGAADDFYSSYERRHDLRHRYPDLHEPSNTEFVRKEKFLDSLRQKDSPDENPDENQGRCALGGDDASDERTDLCHQILL